MIPWDTTGRCVVARGSIAMGDVGLLTVTVSILLSMTATSVSGWPETASTGLAAVGGWPEGGVVWG